MGNFSDSNDTTVTVNDTTSVFFNINDWPHMHKGKLNHQKLSMPHLAMLCHAAHSYAMLHTAMPCNIQTCCFAFSHVCCMQPCLPMPCYA